LPGQRRPGQVPRSALGLARLGTGWGGVDPRFADLGEAWGFQKDILGKTDLAGNVDVEWCRFTSKLSFSFFLFLRYLEYQMVLYGGRIIHCVFIQCMWCSIYNYAEEAYGILELSEVYGCLIYIYICLMMFVLKSEQIQKNQHI
jgi:hypothetical protein